MDNPEDIIAYSTAQYLITCTAYPKPITEAMLAALVQAVLDTDFDERLEVAELVRADLASFARQQRRVSVKPGVGIVNDYRTSVGVFAQDTPGGKGNVIATLFEIIFLFAVFFMTLYAVETNRAKLFALDEGFRGLFLVVLQAFNIPFVAERTTLRVVRYMRDTNNSTVKRIGVATCLAVGMGGVLGVLAAEEAARGHAIEDVKTGIVYKAYDWTSKGLQKIGVNVDLNASQTQAFTYVYDWVNNTSSRWLGSLSPLLPITITQASKLVPGVLGFIAKNITVLPRAEAVVTHAVNHAYHIFPGFEVAALSHEKNVIQELQWALIAQVWGAYALGRSGFTDFISRTYAGFRQGYVSSVEPQLVREVAAIMPPVVSKATSRAKSPSRRVLVVKPAASSKK